MRTIKDALGPYRVTSPKNRAMSDKWHDEAWAHQEALTEAIRTAWNMGWSNSGPFEQVYEWCSEVYQKAKDDYMAEVKAMSEG